MAKVGGIGGVSRPSRLYMLGGVDGQNRRNILKKEETYLWKFGFPFSIRKSCKQIGRICEMIFQQPLVVSRSTTTVSDRSSLHESNDTEDQSDSVK